MISATDDDFRYATPLLRDGDMMPLAAYCYATIMSAVTDTRDATPQPAMPPLFAPLLRRCYAIITPLRYDTLVDAIEIADTLFATPPP